MPKPKKLEPRPGVVKILLTEREKAELQAAADWTSLPIAVFVRVAALEKARRDTKAA